MRALLLRLVAAGVVLFALLGPAAASAQTTPTVRVYLAWWPGMSDGLRAELDSYVDCLLLDSNFKNVFSGWGGANLVYGGSISVPLVPSGGHFGICDGDWAFVNALIDHGRATGTWPVTFPGQQEVPFYVFMIPKSGIGGTNCNSCGCAYSPGCCGGVCVDGFTCGLNNGPGGWYGSDQSQHWLVSWVDAVNCCWSPSAGKSDLQVASSTAFHEIAEEVASYLNSLNGLGGSGVIGDSCSDFPWTGQCPNAPSASYGIQNLNQNGTCDFHPAITASGCGAEHTGCGTNGDCCSGLSCTRDAFGGGVCCKPAPVPLPAGGGVALEFDCGDQRRVTATGDWAAGYYKVESGVDQAATGLSRSAALGHAALFDVSDPNAFPHAACRALAFETGDNRSVTTTGDWDPNTYKGECAADEYVAGFSQSGDHRLHSILCCQGAVAHAACAAMTMAGQDARESTATGDWDPNYWKGECGPGRYAAGASREMASGRPHALLCCGGVTFTPDAGPAPLDAGEADSGTMRADAGAARPVDGGLPGESRGGCGCAGTPAGWSALGLLAAAALRRRRRAG